MERCVLNNGPQISNAQIDSHSGLFACLSIWVGDLEKWRDVF